MWNDTWGGHISPGKPTQEGLSQASSWSVGLSIVQEAALPQQEKTLDRGAGMTLQTREAASQGSRFGLTGLVSFGR